MGMLAGQAGPPHLLTEGDPQVLLDGLPVVRVGDFAIHGPVTDDGHPEGSPIVFVNGVRAALVGYFVVSGAVWGTTPAVGGRILPAPVGCGGDGSPCVPTEYPVPIDVLNAPVRAGDDRIELEDDSDFAVGNDVVIGNHPEDAEIRRVADRGSLVLDRPLERDHPTGTFVTLIIVEDDEAIGPVTLDDADGGNRFVWIVPAVVVVLALGAAISLFRRRRA
jgi:uncharacterized Zn-binding protein involved in type VI secretion